MKALRTLLIALFIPVAAWSQVNYTLPATVVNLDVTAVKENYYAGPYARFARQYLGIDVPLTDYCVTTITEIKVYSSLVADMSATYSIPSWRPRSKFLALTSQGLVAFEKKEEARSNKWSVVAGKQLEGDVLYSAAQPDSDLMSTPIPWEVAPDKPVEILAKDAAEIILSARRERYNISIGNTDATYSGEALQAALEELKRLEEEYLPLFTGSKTVEIQHGFYSICPLTSRKEQVYPAFAISDTEGLVESGAETDTVYNLEFYVSLASYPGLIPATPQKGKTIVHYRVPAICSVKLTGGHQVLFTTQLPVYQLGRELTCPL
ncbi:MAG: DUF4831 family protein [Bacteroidales bacterium]|nr:DUF4831 family protein [Bacteroidales bacterium]